jgi:hypothetical protein
MPKQINPIPGYTPEPDFAQSQGYSEETQKKKRRRGDCPDYIIVNRMAHYADDAITRYFKAKLISPPRQGNKAAA